MRSAFAKRCAAAFGVAALSAAAALTAAPVTVNAAPVTITILNINDFHGRIDPNNMLTTKWATTIEAQRVIDPDALLLSAGDNVGASLFNSAVAGDQPTIDVLNALQLDASAVGNHEFDKGFDDLTNRIINGGTNAKWAYLGANVYLKGTTTPALPEYFVKTVKGVQVAVIGAVTAETPALVSPGGITALDIGDPVAAVNRVADQLTDGNPANGEAQVILAEYHEGAAAGDTSLPLATLASNLAAPAPNPFASIVNDTSPKVAAIFTGHTHQLYAYDAPVPGQVGVTRPVIETGNYADHVGKVTLTVDDATGVVSGHTQTNLVPIAEDLNYPKVAAVKAIVDAAKAYADTIGLQPVGSVTADITTAYTGPSAGYTGPGSTFVGTARDDRAKESTLGDLVANSLRDTLAPANLGGAQIGVVNPGGLRADLFYAPDGVVTYAEANNVLPFVNNLWTTTLTGTQFKILLEQQWQRDANGNVPTRPYLQLGLSDNVTYTYGSTLPEGSRITSITINGAPLNPAANYRIGTFSFLTTGGDNFRIFTQGTNARDSGLVDRDGWISYLTTTSPKTPDFARQAVAVTNLPTAVAQRGAVQFGLSDLDLTSLGSPANNVVYVSIDGVSLGSVPVTGGAAAVNLPVPGSVPAGGQTLTAVACPSGTTVKVPVAVTGVGGGSGPSTAAVASCGQFQITAPATRLVDTREGLGLPTAKLAPGQEVRFDVRGTAGVAADAAAAVLNFTSVNTTADGWIRAYPCGSPPTSDASNLNPGADRIVANLAVVALDSTGQVCVKSYQSTDLVVDLQGWYPATTEYHPLALTRIADTRISVGLAAKLTPFKVVELPVAGANGVAADASAAVLNLTVVSPTPGWVVAFPCGTQPPAASNVNAWPGHAIANAVFAAIGTGGKVCLQSNSTLDLVVDLQGWYPAGASYHAFAPVRALDTRTDGTPLTLGNVRVVPIAGMYGVPGGASIVSLNVTAVNATGPAWVKVFPCGQAVPTASNNNTSPDRIVATQAIVAVGQGGAVCLAANWTTDIVVDVQGWQGTT